MSVPESKEELLKQIHKNFSLLMRKLHDIPTEKTFLKTMEGHVKGDKISVSQLVSYLIGWGELVLSWHDKERNGLEVEFPESGYKWNQLGLLAQKFYRDYQDINSFENLLSFLQENNKKLTILVESFTNDQLYGKAWYGKWTRGRMIQFNTASPYKNAISRINSWRKHEG